MAIAAVVQPVEVAQPIIAAETSVDCRWGGSRSSDTQSYGPYWSEVIVELLGFPREGQSCLIDAMRHGRPDIDSGHHSLLSTDRLMRNISKLADRGRRIRRGR